MTSPSQNSSLLGLVLPGPGDPEYNANGATRLLVLAIQALEAAVFGRTRYTAAGAISIANGSAILQAGSAAAMTLAAPVAGLPSAGGNDGQRIAIIAADAFAYTVTTPTNGIDGSTHVATFAAAVGNSIELVAQNGVWYTVGTPKGVTLS